MAQRKPEQEEKRAGISLLVGATAAGVLAWIMPGAHWAFYVIVGAIVMAGCTLGSEASDALTKLADRDE